MLKQRKLFIINAFVALAMVFAFGPNNVSAGPQAVSSNSWTDDFSSATLDSRWNWVREDPSHWSLSARPGFMRLSTQDGGITGPTNDQNNLLLTTAPSGDFQITTRLSITQSVNNQHAGLVIYQDDDNFVQVDYGYYNGRFVNIETETHGVTSSSQAFLAVNNVYLRLIKQNNIYTGYFSHDKVTWYRVGQGVADLINFRVGVGASNNSIGVNQTNADFDFIELEPKYSNAWKDSFDDPSLDTTWSWKNEFPGYWDMTNKPGYLHIQSQWGAIFSGTAANILLQDSPRADFDIQTHLIFTPTQMMQEAGILIYQTDTDFLYLMRAYCDMPTCVGNGVYFHFMENGGYLGGENPTIVIDPSEVYLKLSRQGKTYTGYFSENGMDWNIVGIHNEGIKFSPVKIGLAVADSGFFAPEIPAYFDYFYLNYSVPYDNSFKLFIPMMHR